MKKSVLLRNPVFMTQRIAQAISDRPTADYLNLCYRLFCLEIFGEICAEDMAANLEELNQSEGRVIGRYRAAEALQQDIYIIGYFSRINPCDIEQNNIVIMYVGEYS